MKKIMIVFGSLFLLSGCSVIDDKLENFKGNAGNVDISKEKSNDKIKNYFSFTSDDQIIVKGLIKEAPSIKKDKVSGGYDVIQFYDGKLYFHGTPLESTSYEDYKKSVVQYEFDQGNDSAQFRFFTLEELNEGLEKIGYSGRVKSFDDFTICKGDLNHEERRLSNDEPILWTESYLQDQDGTYYFINLSEIYYDENDDGISDDGTKIEYDDYPLITKYVPLEELPKKYKLAVSDQPVKYEEIQGVYQYEDDKISRTVCVDGDTIYVLEGDNVYRSIVQSLYDVSPSKRVASYLYSNWVEETVQDFKYLVNNSSIVSLVYGPLNESRFIFPEKDTLISSKDYKKRIEYKKISNKVDVNNKINLAKKAMEFVDKEYNTYSTACYTNQTESDLKVEVGENPYTFFNEWSYSGELYLDLLGKSFKVTENHLDN